MPSRSDRAAVRTAVRAVTVGVPVLAGPPTHRSARAAKAVAVTCAAVFGSPVVIAATACSSCQRAVTKSSKSPTDVHRPIMAMPTVLHLTPAVRLGRCERGSPVLSHQQADWRRKDAGNPLPLTGLKHPSVSPPAGLRASPAGGETESSSTL